MSVAGAIVLVVVVVAATGWALLRRRHAGALQVATATGSTAATITARDLAAPLGERATLVQFSSAFCRPCVAARQVLRGVADMVPGVAHVEVDAESHLDLVRRLSIASTPTTLLVDADGVERRRATGVPRKPEVLAALAEIVNP